MLTAELLTPWDEDVETFGWRDDGLDPAPGFDADVSLDFTERSVDLWLVLRDTRAEGT